MHVTREGNSKSKPKGYYFFGLPCITAAMCGN